MMQIGRFHPTVHNPVNVTEEQFNEYFSASRGNRADSTGLFSRPSTWSQGLRNGPGRRRSELARARSTYTISKVLEWAPPEVVMMCTAPPEHMYVRWQMIGHGPGLRSYLVGLRRHQIRPVHPAGRHASAQASRDFYRRELVPSS